MWSCVFVVIVINDDSFVYCYHWALMLLATVIALNNTTTLFQSRKHKYFFLCDILVFPIHFCLSGFFFFFFLFLLFLMPDRFITWYHGHVVHMVLLQWCEETTIKNLHIGNFGKYRKYLLHSMEAKWRKRNKLFNIILFYFLFFFNTHLHQFHGLFGKIVINLFK